MTQQERDKMIKLLIKLKKINGVYAVANEEQRDRLFNACTKIIDELVAFGFDRVYVETLLIAGKEFLDSLEKSGKLEDMEMGEVIFSTKA